MLQIKKWRAGILTFESRAAYKNPFLDLTIEAVFEGPSAQVIRREAYWDGGNIYKVSFAPTEEGEWKFTLAAPVSTGLDGLSGSLECLPYDGELPIYQHGFLKVSEDGRYLTYADGEPFFWLGDTHWEFAYREKWEESNHPQMGSMFKGMADRRFEQGYNVYQTNLRSDSWKSKNTLYWDESSEEDLPNVAFYQQELDRRMYYLADLGFVNALGLAWSMSIRSEADVPHQINLARYIIARYGALPICWTLCGEVAGYFPGKPREVAIAGWRKVALYIESRDGYNNLQTAHYTNERPFADYYHYEDWYDFTLNQAGHGDFTISASDYQTYRRRYPDKPFIEGEAMYEFCSTLEINGTRECTPDMVRRVAYTTIQCGGCGYTYGAQGIWDCVWEKDSSAEAERKNAKNTFNRFNITWAESIDGPAAAQMGLMKKFYEENDFTAFRPYRQTPDPAEEANPFLARRPLMTANADHTAMILYYSVRDVNSLLIEDFPKGTYVARWFDPRTGLYKPAQTFIPQEGRWTAPERPGMDDMLLVIRKKEG